MVEQMEVLECLSFLVKTMILGIFGILEKLVSDSDNGAHWLVSSARVSSANLSSLGFFIL